MSRDLIALGAVLLLIVGVALVFYPINTSSNQANPTVITETPAPHFPKSPRPTSKPSATTSTVRETTTTLKEEIYHDVLRGGSYRPGDKVSYLSVKGEIVAGRIVDGNVVSSTLYIVDEKDKTLLEYIQDDYESLGHLELISYPQRGDVIMKQNGKELDNCLKYAPGYNFNNYVKVVFDSENAPTSWIKKLTC